MWEGIPQPPREGFGTGLAPSPEKMIFFHLKWCVLVKLTELKDV